PHAGVRVVALNNLLLGSGTFAAREGPATGNYRIQGRDVVDAAAFDLGSHRAAARARPAVDPGEAEGRALRPDREYLHPRRSRPLRSERYLPGAFQSTGR